MSSEQTVVNIERAGNFFIGTNYGHVTQTFEEVNILRSLPIHPDISGHLSDYFLDSRADDEAHILKWIDSVDTPELVLCVLGKVGVGKSTFAKHLATRLRQDQRLAADIFLGFALPDWSPESLVRMAAGQLCGIYPELKRTISEAVRFDVSPSVSLGTRMQKFLLEPIRSLRLPGPLVVLLDAPDQWAPHPTFIKALSCLTTETYLIRFVVLGRPGIEARFQNVSFRRLDLPDVSKSVMGNYFRAKFDEIQWEYGRKPSAETIERLVNKADGLFIWSSTLCSLLEDELSYPNPHETIATILQSQQGVGDNEILADLYHDVINMRFPKSIHQAKLKEFLGAVIVLQEPLPVAAFASLVSMAVPAVRKILADLRPLQAGQSMDTQDMVHPVTSMFHLSFSEYLQSPDTPSHLAFSIDTSTSHSGMGKACLEELRRITPSPHSTFISPLQKYAMRYWPIHTAHGTQTVSPTSDAQWKASPHCAILGSLSVPQWQNWADTYPQLVHPDTSLELDDPESSTVPTRDVPRYSAVVVSTVARSLSTASTTAGTPDAIAMAEVAVRLQHQSPQAWHNLGFAYHLAAESNSSSGLIEHAIRACRSAVELGAGGGHLLLAKCLYQRWVHSGSREDLEEAIPIQREALKLVPPGHFDRALYLNNLAASLISHSEMVGVSESLDEAIELHQEALLLRPPGDPARALSLTNLGKSLQFHFEVTGTTRSLDKAIALLREALSLRPSGDPDRASTLSSLASSLWSHFKLTGTSGSVEEAIALHREALLLRPSGHPGRALCLNDLAATIESYVKWTGSVASLEEAIALFREALALNPSGHPAHALYLNNLAASLEFYFNLTGTAGSLDEAMALHREALFLRPPGHPARAASLNNLAITLQSHFELKRALASLVEAIAILWEALSLRPKGHHARVLPLDNLVKSLRSHFEATGTVESLHKALELGREALSLRPPKNPTRTMCLNNLADSLDSLFELKGTVESLDEVIVLRREVLSLVPPGHPQRSAFQNNLANSLQSHFKLTGNIKSIDEAIALHREVLALRPPGHADRAPSLNNLASCPWCYFESTGSTNVESLDETILLRRETLSLCPPGHPYHNLVRDNLANSLQASDRLAGNIQSP